MRRGGSEVVEVDEESEVGMDAGILSGGSYAEYLRCTNAAIYCV